VLVGLYDAGEDGGMKEPVHLLALERFQMRAEGLPRVSQTFTVADDLKLVRRGLHKGRPGEDIIPPKRAEVAQLMLALAMSPATAGFGPRLEARERVALLLVEAEAMDRENAARLAKRLDALLQIDNPEGARATLCAP
jgi:hypothetical protein